MKEVGRPRSKELPLLESVKISPPLVVSLYVKL